MNPNMLLRYLPYLAILFLIVFAVASGRSIRTSNLPVKTAIIPVQSTSTKPTQECEDFAKLLQNSQEAGKALKAPAGCTVTTGGSKTEN